MGGWVVGRAVGCVGAGCRCLHGRPVCSQTTQGWTRVEGVNTGWGRRMGGGNEGVGERGGGSASISISKVGELITRVFRPTPNSP
jgi:hypothetical protein